MVAFGIFTIATFFVSYPYINSFSLGRGLTTPLALLRVVAMQVALFASILQGA